MLTADDLDGIGADAYRARDPRPYVTELVDAVDHGRLADPEETAYALALAADIAERCGDLEDALRLSTRSVAAAEGTADDGWVRGGHAGLLLRSGDDAAGMRLLVELRPLLTRDRDATSHVIDPLVESGRDELAEEWLTAAFHTAHDVAERAEQDDPDSDAVDDAWEIVGSLARRRRAVRRDLDRDPDDVDAFADELAAAAETSPDLLFWPEAAFAEVLAAAPDRLDQPDWDAHRAAIERELREGDAEGDPPLVEIATPELLTAVLAGDDDAAAAPGPLLDWPPGRNEPCWCGSRTKYKKCCLPRGRA